jgi:hypothetical protein
MYFWKCWRDSRSRYLVILATVVAAAFTFPYTQMFQYMDRARGFIFSPPKTAAEIELAWRATGQGTLLMGSLLAAFFGLAMGAGGLGEELERGSAAFLLTRPRRRHYFQWVRWSTFVLEAFSLCLAAALVEFATLLFFTKHIGNWQLLWPIPVNFTLAVLLFGLSDLLAMVRQKASDGVVVTLLCAIVYLVAVPVIGRYLDIQLPSPLHMYRVMYADARNAGALWTIAGWLAVSACFLGISQFVLWRKEV